MYELRFRRTNRQMFEDINVDNNNIYNNKPRRVSSYARTDAGRSKGKHAITLIKFLCTRSDKRKPALSFVRWGVRRIEQAIRGKHYYVIRERLNATLPKGRVGKRRSVAHLPANATLTPHPASGKRKAASVCLCIAKEIHHSIALGWCAPLVEYP